VGENERATGGSRKVKAFNEGLADSLNPAMRDRGATGNIELPIGRRGRAARTHRTHRAPTMFLPAPVQNYFKRLLNLAGYSG